MNPAVAVTPPPQASGTLVLVAGVLLAGVFALWLIVVHSWAPARHYARARRWMATADTRQFHVSPVELDANTVRFPRFTPGQAGPVNPPRAGGDWRQLVDERAGYLAPTRALPRYRNERVR